MEDISGLVVQQVLGMIIYVILIYIKEKEKHQTYMDNNCHNVFYVGIYVQIKLCLSMCPLSKCSQGSHDLNLIKNCTRKPQGRT